MAGLDEGGATRWHIHFACRGGGPLERSKIRVLTMKNDCRELDSTSELNLGNTRMNLGNTRSVSIWNRNRASRGHLHPYVRDGS